MKQIEIIEWLWRICVCFILLILGVTFLPSIKDYFVRLVFAGALMIMSGGIVYYSLYYQYNAIDKLKLKNKNGTARNKK